MPRPACGGRLSWLQFISTMTPAPAFWMACSASPTPHECVPWLASSRSMTESGSCTRTRISFFASGVPSTSARWREPTDRSRYDTSRNLPHAVSISRSEARCTSDSLRLRYSMRSAMVPILSLCSAANCSRSGRRAIVPSSRMISHSTAAGVRPARRARSQQASVCPARTSTPPGWATSGNTCPGCTMSAEVDLSDEAILMVNARSAAEMPVAMPSAASIDTVKLVPWRERFCSTIGLSPRRAACSSVSGMQIRPRPCLARKLTFSGVTNSAAKMRSPSFSRSSSSTRITISPARIAATTSVTGAMAAVSRRISPFYSRNAEDNLPRTPWNAGDNLPRAPLLLGRAALRAARFFGTDAFADARRLAGALAQVVELGAPHLALALHFDRGDQRRVGLEGALDALARGHLAHDERGIEAAVALGDHHALERLHALALALDHVDADDDGVAGRKVGHVLLQAFDFFLLEGTDEVHDLAPVFLLEFVQQLAFLCVQCPHLQQVGPAQPGPSQRLLQPPAPDVLMVPRQQPLRHPGARRRPDFRPRVLRAIQQPVGEGFLHRRGAVAERARQLPHARVHQRHRRQLAAGEHEVADRDFLVDPALEQPLVHALVPSAQQRQRLLPRKLHHPAVIELAALRRQIHHPAASCTFHGVERSLQRLGKHHHPAPAAARTG